MVVLPSPTAVTVPSPEMVATEVSPILQVGVEEVPITFICTEGLSLAEKVKSVLFRDRLPELVEPPELPELLLEVPLDELERVREILIREMEGVTELSVPLTVECNYGKNWLDAH